ncbi:MAG TPA: phosphotransferase [Gaiellaceae bacterium]|nr:phosphotransferase [Gaiellaceae bacterium]
MSTVATALAPDPAFPRRDELLDAASLPARLGPRLGRHVEECELLRATYHPGRSLRVLLRVEADGETFLVSARMARAGRGSHSDEELPAAIFRFPADRKLVHLPRLMSGEWPRIRNVAIASTRVLGYAPERAATVAAHDASGNVIGIVKLLAPDAAARTASIHDALAARGFPAPFLLERWPELSALAVAPVAGKAVERLEDWAAFGAALAELHALQPVAAPRARASADAAAATIALVRPDVAAAAHRLAAALRRTAEPVVPLVCLHGDVHPKNALVEAGTATLVDLDDVHAGSAAVDLGSALAGLRYEQLVGRRDDAAAHAFLDGYGTLPDEASLRRQTAEALLTERALRAITRLRSEGLERLDEILAAGLEELG